MSGISRRNFVKLSAAAAAAMSVSGCKLLKKDDGIMHKEGKRVVVLGGGWGGTTAAKYIKLSDPSIDVVLVDKHDVFYSCPGSNWVIVGLKPMEYITHNYNNLTKNYGIKFIKAKAEGIDTELKYLLTSAGKIEYDKLIVSPGIDYMYENIEGWAKAAEDIFPHAYKAGPQTILLRKQLEDLKPGENVVMTVPAGPYRCPPGPYERACLLAYYVKKNKPGSKVIVLDANKDIASKARLFHAAFDELYPDIIEYKPSTTVTGVDIQNRLIKTTAGDFTGGVMNIIPDMKAAEFAYDINLLTKKERWVKVKSQTFEARALRDVHVIGDSTDQVVVGPLPKSGFVANSMGKAVADTVVRMLNNQDVLDPSIVNTCYSLVAADEAIFITTVYDYKQETKLIETIDGGLPPKRLPLYVKHAEDWMQSIWSDMLV